MPNTKSWAVRGGAVAPLGPGPQVKGELCGVLVGFPTAGHPRHSFPLFVNAAQPLKEGVQHHAGSLACGGLWIEREYVLRQKGSEALPLLIPPAARAQAQQKHAEQRGNNSFSHDHSPFPDVIKFSIHSKQAAIVLREKKAFAVQSFPSGHLTGKRAEKGLGLDFSPCMGYTVSSAAKEETQ